MSIKQNFVEVSTAHGAMIVPRFDYKRKDNGDYELGVGANLLEFGAHDMEGITFMAGLLDQRRQTFGAGVVMVDAGANIGTVTLSLARHMYDWGKVLAFEPQDPIFMALCGNVMKNNLYHNVKTYRSALGRQDGFIEFGTADYGAAGNFGGVNALAQANIGQVLGKTQVPTRRIDSLGLLRLDLLKLDVEGMEIEALVGGMETISRCRPLIFAEWIICGKEPLISCLTKLGYRTADFGPDLIAAHGPNDIIDQVHEKNAQIKRDAA